MSFTCPRCGAADHHPIDAVDGFCDACKDWTAPWRRCRLGYYGRDGQPMTLREHNARLMDMAYKHVRITAVGDDVEVSTVWLGLDHNFLGSGPPLIFETMVFGGELDEYQWRWPTLEAAEVGHEEAVAEVRARVEAR